MAIERLNELYAALEAVKDLAEHILDEAFDDLDFSAMCEYIVKHVKDETLKTMSFVRDNKSLIVDQK